MARSFRRSNLQLLALICLSTTMTAVKAGAATFLVTNTNDSGAGSLRQAVLDANGAAGGDTINFGALFNTPQTITLTSGEIAITGQLIIDASANAGKVTISGNIASRIFNINDGAPGAIAVSLQWLKLLNGYGPPAGRGGAILVANETLTLIDCTFMTNFSQDSGGAINVDGPGPLVSMYAVRCTFEANHAPNNGGGAISSYVPLDLNSNESTFRFNDARGGGAIGQFAGGALNIFASTFQQNAAQEVDGGALFLNSAFTSALITNSTFSGNAANNNGGAIALMTVSSIATPGLQIFNSTFAMNGALLTGGAICRRTGSTANIALTSSIFWQNGPYNILGPDCWTEGALVADHVLIGSTAGITTLNADAFTTGHVGVDPRLNYLDSYGGWTQTHSLKPGSVAIDNGNNLLGFSFDQRGVGYARLVDGNCNLSAVTDIGAFEAQACMCPGDVNGNGITNIDDLVMVITSWGSSSTWWPADLNSDGIVNIDDLVLVITDWGICS